MASRPFLVAFVFSLLICLNWLYVLWVAAQPDLIINAWFILIPISGYFYFTFAIIAAIGLYYQKRVALNLAYCVVMAGMLSAGLSYLFVFQHHPVIGWLLIPLLFINGCVLLYLALTGRRDAD